MLNAKLSTLQLNKLKSGIKNGTEINLNLSSNAVGESSKTQLSKMIQSGVILMPSDFTNLPSLVMVVSNIDKMQNLARTVSDLSYFKKC